MKVLLLQDVEHLGKAGEIKDVSGGFGRNYLLPKGFAVLATKSQVKQAEERLAAQRRKAEAARKEAEALAARLAELTLTFTVKVGEQDRLYGSVTNADIAAKLHEVAGIEIDRRKIGLEDPIKRTGEYEVPVELMSGVSSTLKVVVVGE
ncbi:MAG TPA: 50S ribosomal protein L9 [Chloroflexus aurantiacus]|jgi:large subunit ribosomal protein L9|uniref:Large ribosomal subunit protein bL9 n=2 Tax=Chloroflexus TaxID=1107 RepID=RL9_CHLAA|nr:50S ribosomal protein L9 [Chloroflexus aurantiacus]A9WHR4.1 RecName: Full=Large ribosomal subunit protein bL9; AltName: Full=50S ribosomal protein L9 [Chloroflexus aurantiacus J-10-fl]ABY34182.1 ribosomal protein L9 [Chloroflexus aurantiacus J-10-fl]RMG53262.1 MAG: 50S ribosomal protein L9 [Chloroflexota bacterium]HBW67098.1 50S ribosomal protein L9 [Chloroflexus aurantiacus]